ncbi:hypothetical protein [Roseibium sp.]|uniref:DUF1269 domain-containing protein n=1 Tax=Roseibium sp. TaxID=1936156 RepID=UPI003B51BE86
MEKIVTVVFDTEADAFKGGEALRDLHWNGDVTVYSAGIIEKDANGEVSIKKEADEGPIGTALGMVVGAMIGVLAGPAAVASGAAVAGSAAAASAATGGLALGSLTGGTLGMIGDLYKSGVDLDILDEVSAALEPGKFALIASVEEYWTAPTDIKMKAAGGQIFRQSRIDVVDDMFVRDMETFDRDLATLNEELKEANEENRAAIKASIENVKARMTASKEKAEKRLSELSDDFKERTAKLDEQLTKAAEGAKTKIEKRKSEIKEDYEERSAKLKKAAGIAKEALT